MQYYFTFQNQPDVHGRCGIFYALVRLYKAKMIKLGHRDAYEVQHGVYDKTVYPPHAGMKVVAVRTFGAKLTCCYYRGDD